MEAKSSLKSASWNQLRWPSRRTMLRLAGVLVLAACGWAAWKAVADPPQPWLLRWRLARYLKNQSHVSNFKVDFPFPSKAEMAKAPPKRTESAALAKGSRTGKDFDALRGEYFPLKTAALALEREIARNESRLKESMAQLDELSKQLVEAQASGTAKSISSIESKVTTLRERVATLQKNVSKQAELRVKEEALAPIVSDLWELQRPWLAEASAAESTGRTSLARARAEFAADMQQRLDQASSYAEMYRVIGQELWVANRLLPSANPEHRRTAMSLALSASHHALDDTRNDWVAARICQGYILPNLDLADDPNRRSPFNVENLLNECADIFRRNNEFQNVVHTYQIYLSRTGNSQRADWARAQIAMAHEQGGDPKRALEYLRQIRNTNDFRGVLRRVPRLEQQVKAN